MKLELVLGILAGLAVNELCDVSPWLAKLLVRRASYLRYGRNASRAEIRAAEWAAIIEERPGKLLKLFSAVGFFGSGLWSAAGRSLRKLFSVAMHAALEASIKIFPNENRDEPPKPKGHYVKSYVRSDGTQVRGHWRANRDGKVMPRARSTRSKP